MTAPAFGLASGPVRWGFLGAGWIARRALAPAVHAADGAALVAVAARDASRARQLGPSGQAYEAYERLLEDPAVEVVYICLSNEAHLPWTLQALAAGKHVLCEKPLGLTAAEVQQMSAGAEQAGLLVVEATFSRWHPRTRRAEALVASGGLGRVRGVDAGFTFPQVSEGNYRLEPARGGGALYDIGPYAVGAALWAVPGAPVRVREVAVDRHPSGVDLTTSAVLALGAAEATVRTSVASAYGEWVRIIGDEATLVLDSPAFTSWLAPSTLRVLGPEDIVHHFAPVDPYQVMVEHVSRAVRGDASAWVLPLAESERVASALDAIRAAA
jgi:D-xylose 1-dehydrogenase (NADP+, D-xylono-1,5-lactone-forming)